MILVGRGDALEAQSKWLGIIDEASRTASEEQTLEFEGLHLGSAKVEDVIPRVAQAFGAEQPHLVERILSAPPTNSLLVAAPKEDLDEVMAFIRALDE